MTDLLRFEGTPGTTTELLDRASRLAGRTLLEVAETLGEEVPEDTTRHKGWAGGLIERFLGSTAGNRAAPDFEALGVELKTLPVGLDGKPLESTYVTTVPLSEPDEESWEESKVLLKLKRVLWVPILGLRDVPLKDRMVGRAILWSPSSEDLEILRKDWEAHMRAIREGFVDATRGSDGTYLQIRPKAKDSNALTWTVDEYGSAHMTLPRGFYLRTLLTEMIVRQSLEATTRSLESLNSTIPPDGEDV